MPDHEKFFDKFDGYRLTAKFFECHESFFLEELYQAFKARLMDELAVQSEELLYSGELIDIADTVEVVRDET